MRHILNAHWELTDEAPAPRGGRVWLVCTDSSTPYRSDEKRVWQGKIPPCDAYAFALILASMNGLRTPALDALDAFEHNTRNP
jgi:hypothetical protein